LAHWMNVVGLTQLKPTVLQGIQVAGQAPEPEDPDDGAVEFGGVAAETVSDGTVAPVLAGVAVLVLAGGVVSVLFTLLLSVLTAALMSDGAELWLVVGPAGAWTARAWFLTVPPEVSAEAALTATALSEDEPDGAMKELGDDEPPEAPPFEGGLDLPEPAESLAMAEQPESTAKVLEQSLWGTWIWTDLPGFGKTKFLPSGVPQVAWGMLATNMSGRASKAPMSLPEAPVTVIGEQLW